MEYTSIGEFETLVNYFTDADQLMDFTATWEIQDSPAVLLRLYRLRNLDHDDTLINEKILQTCDRTRQQSATNMDLEYVRKEMEIEESVKALMFDDEMDDIARACIEDGNWNPLIQVHLVVFVNRILIIYSTLIKHMFKRAKLGGRRIRKCNSF